MKNKRFIKDMRREQFHKSTDFIGDYLNFMRSENPEGAALLEADVVEVFSSEKGLRVLKLLEKSVLHRVAPDGSDDRALREANAKRNLVLEIRRIVSHGAQT